MDEYAQSRGCVCLEISARASAKIAAASASEISAGASAKIAAASASEIATGATTEVAAAAIRVVIVSAVLALAGFFAQFIANQAASSGSQPTGCPGIHAAALLVTWTIIRVVVRRIPLSVVGVNVLR